MTPQQQVDERTWLLIQFWIQLQEAGQQYGFDVGSRAKVTDFISWLNSYSN